MRKLRNTNFLPTKIFCSKGKKIKNNLETFNGITKTCMDTMKEEYQALNVVFKENSSFNL